MSSVNSVSLWLYFISEKLVNLIPSKKLEYKNIIMANKEKNDETIRENFKTPIPTLIPLFWLKTEDENVIRHSIAVMSKAGANGFILENRNNPLYLSEEWWQLVGICLDEAKQRNMKLWLWDEKFFPSGTAGGRVMQKNPDYCQKIIEEKIIDISGYKNIRLPISEIVDKTEDKLFATFACKKDPNNMNLIKLELRNNMLEWDIPEGEWQILTYLMKDKSDWVDVLNPDATQAFIDLVYEEAYKRFTQEFGHTFAGFFSDETGIRNVYNYYSLPGKNEPLAWTASFSKEFAIHHGYKLEEMLPALWHNIGELTKKIRRDYMNTISRLFAENFFGKIYDWCENRNAKFIGHVIEDNGAHYRMGHGCTHYFRVMEKFHIPGVDIVLKQVLPGKTEQKSGEPFETPFFYWVLAKLASSASHIYNVPENLALLEAFGAYGWYEGLRMAKWLTDWALVRGINIFTPHAFNPKYPDSDCPPHYGLEGIDPQWQYFNVWSDYTNRMCQLLSGGKHIAPVLFLYPAESLWTDDAEPIEDTARILLQSQMDFDFIPYDSIIDDNVTAERGDLSIANESYRCFVIPQIHVLPLPILKKIYDLASEGCKIIFINDFPERSDEISENDEFQNILNKLKSCDSVNAVKQDSLAQYLQSIYIQDISINNPNPNLRYIHRMKGKNHIFLFFNESLHEAINTDVNLYGISGQPEIWDSFSGVMTPLTQYNYDKGLQFALALEPYQSLVIFVSEKIAEPNIANNSRPSITITDISEDWNIEISTPSTYPTFREEKRITGLGDFSNAIPDFAGTVAYEKEINISNDLNFGKVILDLGEAYEIVSIFINSHKAIDLICPPYRYDITKFIRKGKNYLRIEVTNTLANAVKDIDKSFSGSGPFPFGLIGAVKMEYYEYS